MFCATPPSPHCLFGKKKMPSPLCSSSLVLLSDLQSTSCCVGCSGLSPGKYMSYRFFLSDLSSLQCCIEPIVIFLPWCFKVGKWCLWGVFPLLVFFLRFFVCILHSLVFLARCSLSRKSVWCSFWLLRLETSSTLADLGNTMTSVHVLAFSQWCLICPFIFGECRKNGLRKLKFFINEKEKAPWNYYTLVCIELKWPFSMGTCNNILAF